MNNQKADAGNRVAVTTAGIFLQFRRGGVLSGLSSHTIMPKFVRASCIAVGLASAGLLIFPSSASAQTNLYNPNGTEYAVIGGLPGDQVHPDAAVATAGGFVVWQDNITDGDSSGISARRLDGTLSGTLGTFRVNATGAGIQENPRVAMLKNGGAVFVWEGGRQGFQHIYARFLTPTNTFLTTNDVLVNTFPGGSQQNPAVAVLNNSNVVFVWASVRQAASNSMQDVYGQMFSPAGQKVGGEFLVNQYISFNQREPAVAALSTGGFVVAWVSEQARVPYSPAGSNFITSSAIVSPTVDINARLYNSSGTATTGDILVNPDNNPCGTPALAGASDGSFMVTWASRTTTVSINGWDVFARSFSSSAVGGTAFRVNTYQVSDQYFPRLSGLGLDYMVTWTSLGQDGSRAGVYGQCLRSTGLVGGEFRVNTSTISDQLHPVVAADGASQFLVVWTSFTGIPYNFDLMAQRYVNNAGVLVAMPAPFVWVPFVVSNNVYQPRLVVSWAPLLGLSVSNYEVYVDGSLVTTNRVTTNLWTMTAANGLTTNSTHSFTVDYVLTDGRRSPLSPSASGSTWLGLNWGGIPYEWMAAFFGGYFNGSYTTTFWPPATTVLAANTTLLNVFIEGGNPLDSSTWLKQQLLKTPQGLFLSWNTQPGAMYQVQVKTTLTASSWINLGAPRFAAGTTDSIYVGGSSAGYYRLQLLR